MLQKKFGFIRLLMIHISNAPKPKGSGPAMLIQPIDYFLVAWFALAALSTAYVCIDQFRNNPGILS